MSSAHITFDTTGDKIARRVRKMRPSAVRNLFAAATRDDVISLSGGMPAVSLLPEEDIRRATLAAIRDDEADLIVGTHAILSEGVEFARLGLAVVESTVSSQEEVAQAAAELCGQADAVFTPPDSTVAAAAGEAAQAAKTAGVPWYTGDSAMVQAGALASMSVTGREAGVKTADMAVQLIQGRDVAQVPVFTFSDSTTYVNQTTLEALTSLSFPAEVLQTAFVCQ